MLPYVEKHNKVWKKFDPDDFNTRYAAHSALYNDIRNKVKKFNDADEKQKKESERAKSKVTKKETSAIPEEDKFLEQNHDQIQPKQVKFSPPKRGPLNDSGPRKEAKKTQE